MYRDNDAYEAALSKNQRQEIIFLTKQVYILKLCFSFHLGHAKVTFIKTFLLVSR